MDEAKPKRKRNISPERREALRLQASKAREAKAIKLTSNSSNNSVLNPNAALQKGESILKAGGSFNEWKDAGSSIGTSQSLSGNGLGEHTSVSTNPLGSTSGTNNGRESICLREGIQEAGSSKLLGSQVHSEPSPSSDQHRPKPESNDPSGSVEITGDRLRQLRDAIGDPIKWGEWLFECKLDEWQRETCRSFVEGKRIARAVCNGGGKTRIFAILGTWLLARYANARVIMTAGSYRQCEIMRDMELRRVMHKLSGWTLKESELVHPYGNQFLWFSADNAGYFEGHHADHIGVLIDEGKSVDKTIYDASERLTANKKRYCMVASSTGNQAGWFYECFTANRDLWDAKQISAYNISRISRNIIEDAERMRDRNPALFKSKILAEFTDIDVRNMVNLEQINRCLNHVPPWRNPGFKVAGIDLSAAKKGGDELVCVPRQGNKIFEPYFVPHCESEMEAVGLIVAWLRKEQVRFVFVDQGGLGSPMVARLREIISDKDPMVQIHGIDFGGKTLDVTSNCKNRGVELWQVMANKIEMRELIFDWTAQSKAKFIAQTTTRSVETTSDGSIRLEAKDKMRARGLKSPDLSDATALALIEPANENRSVFATDLRDWNKYKTGEHNGERQNFGFTSSGKRLGRG